MTSTDCVLHGVDFSGAKRPESKIWVSTLEPGGAARTRSGYSHRSLREAIESSAGDGRPHRWLIDTPFGLSQPQLESHGLEPTWEASLEWIASFPSPRDWRRACREVSRKEIKRRGDVLARTPHAPTNLRLFKQTWHGLVKVVAPLARHPDVAIVPVQSPVDSVWVGEGCPSSVLRRLEWPHQGYKGGAEKNRELRADLAARLETEAGLPLDPDAWPAAVEQEDGDALDSLLLLIAARRFAEHDPAELLEREPLARIEAWVYD